MIYFPRFCAFSIRSLLKQYIYSYIKFVHKKITLGYNENLWKTHIGVLVETECRRNLEGNFKVSLQGVYGEYVDILKVSVFNFLLNDFWRGGGE
jgi:hypothetical protein